MLRLWEWDKEVFDFINQGLRSPWADAFFRFFTWLGLGWVQIGILLLIWLKEEKLRESMMTCFIGWSIASVITHTLKFTIDRVRPSTLLHAFVAQDEKILIYSFPSGHTATSFAIACALALSLPKHRLLVSSIAFVVAFLVGVSRIYRGVHWPTDIIASALLGFSSGILAHLLMNNWKERRARLAGGAEK
ncbi:MAG TPA: phosphatase PAP2 family protein [Fimbriimonadales bacterium]|nr:phosphatase PAP2 family protein [Fimbriimonadales bacterium]